MVTEDVEKRNMSSQTVIWPLWPDLRIHVRLCRWRKGTTERENQKKAGAISSPMTELLFCASTVQWSFTALRRGRTRECEKDKGRQRERERERENVYGTSASTPHPCCCCLQSEECCISWGQCRGQGGRGSFLLRSPYSKHGAWMQKQPAANTETERDGDTKRETDGQRQRERQMDRDRETETDELQHSARCLCCPMFSTKNQLHIIRGQKREWIIFTPRKMCPHISVPSLKCPLTVLWLDVFVCSLI